MWGVWVCVCVYGVGGVGAYPRTRRANNKIAPARVVVVAVVLVVGVNSPRVLLTIESTSHYQHNSKQSSTVAELSTPMIQNTANTRLLNTEFVHFKLEFVYIIQQLKKSTFVVITIAKIFYTV